MSQMENDAATGTPVQAPPAIPLWKRMFQILIAPRSVFESLAAHPAWIGATVLLLAAGLLVTLVIYDPVVYPYSMEQAELQGNSDEQIAQVDAFMSSPVGKAFAVGMNVIASLVFVLVTGLMLFVATSFLLGGKVTFRDSLSVAANSYLLLVFKSIVIVPIMISRIDPTLSLGPGVFLPPSEAEGFTASFIAQLLAGLDLFQLWILGLCILGMSVVAKLPTAKVGTLFAIGYGVIILVWSAIGAALSG